MTYEKQKHIKILDELTSFCYLRGASHIYLHIDHNNECTTCSLECSIPNFTEKDMQNLKDALDTPRCHEMEEYYWELIGDIETESELSLIGMMIDYSSITLDDGILKIIIKRKSE